MDGPSLTVDVIIEMGQAIVLIERKHPPAGWALPGGFVDAGERTAVAARREAKEETGLEVELLELLGVYSDPARDARRHTVSVVYIGRAEGTPQGADDAKQARLYRLGELPALAFDHGTILEDYARYRRHGTRPPLRR